MCEFSIEELIGQYPEKDKLPCAVAHLIAVLAEKSPLDVGKAADDLSVELTYCQLGLFGYGRKRKSTYKILGRPVEIEKKILDEIKAESSDGKIICTALWQIADEGGISRAEAGNAADSLGLKIKGCQLGVF
jgi:hypothetical protein